MKKTFACVFALLLLGSAFLFAGGAGRVKEGVIVSEVAVGGMPYAEAISAVREKLAAERVPFTVHTPFGDTMPAVTYTDNVPALLRRAKKGERLQAEVRRVWVDAEGEMARLAERCMRPPQDAALSFSRFGFSYAAEEAGAYCDYAASLAAAELAKPAQTIVL